MKSYPTQLNGSLLDQAAAKAEIAARYAANYGIDYWLWKGAGSAASEQNFRTALDAEQGLLIAERLWARLADFADSDYGVLEPYLPANFTANLRDALEQLNTLQSELRPAYDALTSAVMDEVRLRVAAGELADDTEDRINQKAQRSGLGVLPLVPLLLAAVTVCGLAYLAGLFAPNVIAALGDIAVKWRQQSARQANGSLILNDARRALEAYNAKRLEQSLPPIFLPGLDDATKDPSGSGSGFSSGALVGVVGTVAAVGLGVWALSALFKGNK